MFHRHQISLFWTFFCFYCVIVVAATFSLPAIGQDISPQDGAKTRPWVAAQSFSGAYLAGRFANANYDVSAAIDYLSQALTFSPDHIQIKQDLLIMLLSNQQFDKAVSLAAQLTDAPEIERYSRLVLAADAFNAQNFAAIAPLLEFEDPDLMDNLVVTLLDSWALFGQGETQAATQNLEMLEGPVWYDIFRHYHLALMYGLIGDEIRTQTAFEHLLEDPASGAQVPESYERIIIAYAAYLYQNGDSQAALNLLQKGEETLVGRNVFAMMRKRIHQHEALPFIITNAREGAAELLYNVGTLINRPGGEVHARLYFNIALGLRPNHDATLFQLAVMNTMAGWLPEAVELYQQIETRSPYWHDGRWRLSLALADQGKRKEAINLLENLLVSDAMDENLTLSLASIHVQNKDFAQVVAITTRYINAMDKTQPDTPSQDWRIFFQRGIAYERLQQWEQAEADFRQSLRLSPEQPQVLNYLGYSLIDRNMKLEEAFEMVHRAVGLRPKDGAIIDSLGWAYYKFGAFDMAIEALEEAVKLRPEDPTINDHLGDAYWQVGRKFEAVFQWKHALAGEPESEEERIKIEEKLKGGIEEIPPAITSSFPGNRE